MSTPDEPSGADPFGEHEQPEGHGTDEPGELQAGEPEPDGFEEDDPQESEFHEEATVAPLARPGRPGRPGRRGRRRGGRRRSTGLRVLLWALGLVLLVVIVVVGWYELQVHPPASPGRAVVVTVKGGDGNRAVAAELSSHGVIASSLAYRIYAKLHGSPTVDPGEYIVHQHASFASLSSLFSSGPNVHSLVAPAGFTLRELAERQGDLPGRSASAFLATADSGAVHSPWQPAGSKNLEGLLGTGTYLVLPGESNTTLLRDMVARFDAQASAAGATPAAAATLGVTPYQLVTVASIVEKEGYIPGNMPRVARVIYNRLENDMPLQMNSTVLYALGQDGGQVTSADEQLDSPYNTYLNTGLTPTPICFPSPQALRAAAHPPEGDWLYFVVVTKSGDEAFSHTYSQQLAKEALAQQRGVG